MLPWSFQQGEFNLLEVLYVHRETYGHLLQQICLQLDPTTLANMRFVSHGMKCFVDNRIWNNSRAHRIMRNKLWNSWTNPINPDGVPKEAAFQCSEDVFDLKIRGDSILCGLRNGTIEVWNKYKLTKIMSLEEQHGSVQVDANDDVIVGVSSDSTVCIWCRKTGELKDVLYHHRASVWGVRIQNNHLVTGSMDGTIAVIDIPTLTIRKHFLAHEDEWGVSELDTTPSVIVSGCFGGRIHVWDLETCQLQRVIHSDHAVNCVSVHGDVIVSCSRTGRQSGVANVILWDIATGLAIRKLDLPSACYVKLDCDKLVALVAAGDAIIGEHHMVKWPIARVLVLKRPDWNVSSPEKSKALLSTWDVSKVKAERLLRYLRTPAVTASRTMLIYSQSREDARQDI